MKATILSIIIAIVFIGGAVIFTASDNDFPATDANNTTIIDGKQIIEITARGGYQPRRSIAKIGIPTIIRFKTNSTYDCSIAVRIPSLRIAKNLPPSGSTDIDIGSREAGTLRGSCGMGMYVFEIDFRI